MGVQDFVIVRERLERQRAKGRPFTKAWPRAIGGLERAAYVAAMETMAEWRDAYEGRPASAAVVSAARLRACVETAGGSDVVETSDEEVERLASLIRRTELFGID